MLNIIIFLDIFIKRVDESESCSGVQRHVSGHFQHHPLDDDRTGAGDICHRVGHLEHGPRTRQSHLPHVESEEEERLIWKKNTSRVLAP